MGAKVQKVVVSYNFFSIYFSLIMFVGQKRQFCTNQK